ncbi:hypothetical protein P20652_2494 [Pseudoalteromonas sp. BSi20652]|uniref:hypothetical protein n=1 Tax=Pseudoalteromonas sp. BSi20652 TaxID=388384 RepID=UPI000231913A|nr:hypothetical protein [Pseudoalteromonas sp. BSi20652]GAA60628.1 hypothetical protein P20652_2494 [Pseudoalteromonas sp. BSi20652]
MSISYKFAKLNARTIENSQNFKNYLSKKRFNKFTGLMGFQIVKILVLKDEEKRLKDSNSIDNEGRYLGFHHAADWTLGLTLGPIFLGVSGSIVVAFILLICLYTQFTATPEPLPVWFIVFVICWNLFFLNFGPILARYILPKREVYFDRQNQTVSFSWSVNNAEKNEHGHSTFPFTDIEAFYSKANHSQGHGVTHAMYIAHKDYENHRGAFSEIRVKDNPQNPNYCKYTWERVVRFMDVTKPLVDSPEIEPFRNLDPITHDFDKQNNRPEKYWRSMSYKQIKQIEEALDDDIYRFNFDGAITNPKRWANKEITKPWEKWPIDESLNQPDDTPYWKRLMKTLAMQIIAGV